jgi:Ca-activated chloride channel homolog
MNAVKSPFSVKSPTFPFLALLLAFFFSALPVSGQTLAEPSGSSSLPVLSIRRPVDNIVVPQARFFSTRPGVDLRITGVEVRAVIIEQAATTTMEISLVNPGSGRVEAELLVPVPDGSVVRGFTFEGAAAEAVAQVLPKDEARRIYESIVSRMRDPALLEFAGCNLVRTSLFPVEAGSSQKVRLVYENILTCDGNRIDYVLPRSESLGYTVPWTIDVSVRTGKPLSTVYSPSHGFVTRRVSAREINLRTTAMSATAPGTFRLCCLREGDDVTASLFAYPDAKTGGGYFLLLAGLPADLKKSAAAASIKRDVVVILDRSGSMKGGKLDQAREAALQVLEGLAPGESFNLIAYNDTLSLFSEKSVVKTKGTIADARRYLEGITAQGGTNIHDALIEALRGKAEAGALPIALFLTDGLPTVGQTSEVAIRNAAVKNNPFNRRVFTFGVGVDVNTPLLNRIANDTRAKATFVLPNEDVEVKVGHVFRGLTGPVLAEPLLTVIDDDGRPAPHRVLDLIPARLPDLYEDDQLVLTGRYVGDGPLRFRVSGSFLGRQRTFDFRFGLGKTTVRNGFVPRLWASRKIGVLVDSIRQLGADSGVATELVDEVVRLSTEFGILTEYTAFLAREGTDLSNEADVLAEASVNFLSRAVSVRSGLAAVNQDNNINFQKAQGTLNPRNSFFNAEMKRVEETGVQQVNDLAFYRRGDQWVDSRVVQKGTEIDAQREIAFGSPEFHRLALRLAGEGRQGSIALRGDIVMVVDGETVLVKGAGTR